MKRLKLNDRIRRVNEGLHETEFISNCVSEMSDMPIMDYLKNMETERRRLQKILGYSEEKMKHTTYLDVAREIHNLRKQTDKKELGNEALEILTWPFRCYNSERRII